MPTEKRNNMIDSLTEETIIEFITRNYNVHPLTAIIAARRILKEMQTKNEPIYNTIYKVQEVIENKVGIARA